MNGRKLWFVGIGGAGLSAYAQLARAWGATVGGWDRVATPYLEALGGIAGRDLARARSCPAVGRRSSRRPTRRVAGPARARSSCAELVSARRSIVVAGTHGKGTTAAMIAYVLRETGRDPAWLIGAPVPQLGSNAGGGQGLSRRRGGRVGSHRLLTPCRDRGGHEHRARPPHRVRVGSRTGRASSTAGSPRRAPSSATRPRTRVSSRCRASLNRLNAGSALRRSSWPA